MSKNYIVSILLPLLTVSFVLTSKAQQTEQKFVQQTSYLLYLPDGYLTDTTKRWPVLLSLHGAGEIGTDIEKVKIHGPAKLIAQGKKFPFIVVSPQSLTYGWKPEQLHDLLIDIKRKYKVDDERVYVSGLSMGGFGAWEMALKYPREIAAIVPICGGGDTSKLWILRNMPVWCFHGAKDQIVPLSSSQRMMKELEKDNSFSKFTIYPETYHDSWVEAYNNDSLYTWLLAQKRFQYKQVSVDKSILSKYIGKYLGPKNDTVSIEVKGNNLVILFEKDNSLNIPPAIEAIPASENLFFFYEKAHENILFEKNTGGIVTAFIFYIQEKMRFTKLSPVNNRKRETIKK